MRIVENLKLHKGLTLYFYWAALLYINDTLFLYTIQIYNFRCKVQKKEGETGLNNKIILFTIIKLVLTVKHQPNKSFLLISRQSFVF